MTLLPLVFLGTNTLYGGFLNITDQLLPARGGRQRGAQRGGLDSHHLHGGDDGARGHHPRRGVQKWISVLNGGPVPATAEPA